MKATSSCVSWGLVLLVLVSGAAPVASRVVGPNAGLAPAGASERTMEISAGALAAALSQPPAPPASPAPAPVPAAVAPAPGGLAGSPVIVSGWDGLHFGTDNGISNLWVPPDVQIASGPNHVVEMVNLLVGIYTKQGSQVSVTALSTFFNSGSDFISDPKVQYDAGSGRWFASLTDISATQVLLAVSTSSDPTGSWRVYQVPGAPTGECLDQPILGLGGTTVILSVNVFTHTRTSPCTNPFLGAQYWVINKTDLVTGVNPPSVYESVLDVNEGSIHPAQIEGVTDVHYMVSTYWPGTATTSNTLHLFAVSGTPPGVVTVAVTSLSMPTAAIPPAAPQNGSKNTLDTSDIRVSDASWQDGKLWLGFDEACLSDSTRACIRLVEIDTTAKTIVQDFDLDVAGKSVFYPAFRTDGAGDLAVVMAYSSSLDYPGIMATSRVYADPPNTFAPPMVVVAGTGPESPSNCKGTCRYGDYFGAAVDPSNPLMLWGVGEYGSGSGWGTHVFSAAVKAILNFAYTVVGGGRGYSAPVLSYVEDGVSTNATLSATPTSYAADPGTLWNVPPFLNGSGNAESWAADESPGAPFWSQYASRSLTITWRYFHQYVVVFDFSIIGGGQPSPPNVTFTSFGIATTQFAEPRLKIVDAGSSYAYAAVLPLSNSRVRYAGAGDLSGTITKAATITVSYYAQYNVTFQYAFRGGSGTVAPDVTYTSLGSTTSVGTNATVWVDANTLYVYNVSLPGNAAGVRWAPSTGSSGTISFSTTITVTYGLQYLVSVVPNASGAEGLLFGGGWYNSGTYATIWARSNMSWRFTGWSGAASGTNASIVLKVGGPLTAEAMFDPGLTITAGSGGSVTYAYGSQSGTVSAGSTATIFLPIGTRVTLTERANDVTNAFAGWSGNASGADSSISITIDGPASVGASFGPNVVVLGGVSALVILAVVLIAFLVAMRRRGRRPPGP